jgi:hypothetical protein
VEFHRDKGMESLELIHHGTRASRTVHFQSDTSCNFNVEATSDDDSCTYAAENFDCDGNCTAVEVENVSLTDNKLKEAGTAHWCGPNRAGNVIEYRLTK